MSATASATAANVVGRDDELAVLAAFVDAEPSGLSTLLLEGEPGIGKTTLWNAAVFFARERRWRVLACRPAGAEVQLSFAALGDLLEDVLSEALPELPRPRRRALEVALLLQEARGQPPNQRAVGLALLDVLLLLARSSPVLIAIDDLQWLDAPTAAVLGFALRRVGSEPIGLLAALRIEGGRTVPTELEGLVPEGQLERLAIGPLSIGALHRLLSTRLGAALPRPTLLRVHEQSGGNPFFALEIARGLERMGGRREPGERLPVPERLEELVRARLAALPQGVQEVLRAAVAQSEPTISAVKAASSNAETVVPHLEVAFEAGVIELEGERICFTHPLFAASVYSASGTAERRELHRRLAQVSDDPEERARHLALGAEGPSAAVATAVDGAVEHAAARGASAAAAELADLAVTLTPPEDDAGRRRRSFEAATHQYLAGDLVGSTARLEQLLRETPAGVERADVLLQLCATREDDLAAITELCRQALREAAADDARSAAIESRLGYLRLWDDVRAALRHARAGLRRAQRISDPFLHARVLAAVGAIETYALEISPGLLERAVELEKQLEQPLALLESPGAILGLRLMYLDEFDESRRRLEAGYAQATEWGAEDSRCAALFYLTELEVRAGDWERAAEHAATVIELSEQIGKAPNATLYAKALVDAHLGRVDDARAAATQGARFSLTSNDVIMEIQSLGVLGFLELSLGNMKAAASYLEPLPARLVGMGWNEPTVYPVWPDAIEALLGMGELRKAHAYLEQFQERAERSTSPWALATAARCAGLLAAAEGDLTGAVAAFERALAEHERTGPFERGRTLLALGETQRRAKRKRAARESLEAALAIFEELGARLWAKRAQAELRRIGGRAPASGELTPTERRVAELVAEGHTNREVAAELFVTVRAVEWNLSNIYRKLGLRSRTELAHHFAVTAGAKPES